MPLKAKGYIVVKASRNSWDDKVNKLSITRTTVNKPSTEADEEAIQVELEFPDDYFDQNAPVIKAVMTGSATGSPPVIPTTVRPRARSDAAKATIGEA